MSDEIEPAVGCSDPIDQKIIKTTILQLKICIVLKENKSQDTCTSCKYRPDNFWFVRQKVVTWSDKCPFEKKYLQA